MSKKMKIIKCDTLPNWINSSDRAAYHPLSKTIYIRKDQTTLTLIHEIGHYLIDISTGSHMLQKTYDRLWYIIFVADFIEIFNEIYENLKYE